MPEVEVEHIGSTAVPGCAGKGHIDLMVLYSDGALETTKAALAALGFQPQTSRILIGLAAGLVIGLLILASQSPALLKMISTIEIAGTLWVSLLKMTVIPLVMSLLITWYGIGK